MLWQSDWLEATLTCVSYWFGADSNCVCVRPRVLKFNDNFTLLLLLLHVNKKKVNCYIIIVIKPTRYTNFSDLFLE